MVTEPECQRRNRRKASSVSLRVRVASSGPPSGSVPSSYREKEHLFQGDPEERSETVDRDPRHADKRGNVPWPVLQGGPMRDALAHHDELLRAVVESLDGCVVKSTGDGFHVAFCNGSPTPRSAHICRSVHRSRLRGQDEPRITASLRRQRPRSPQATLARIRAIPLTGPPATVRTDGDEVIVQRWLAGPRPLWPVANCGSSPTPLSSRRRVFLAETRARRVRDRSDGDHVLDLSR
jgi:hypothetical protein